MSNPNQSIQSCPIQEKGSENQDELCKFGDIQIYKLDSEHANFLLIKENDDDVFIYEIVAGNSNNLSTININVSGIQTQNCYTHPSAVVEIIPPLPYSPVLNQDEQNNVKVGYPYKGNLFAYKSIDFPLNISSCKNLKNITIKVYPDSKFGIEFSASLSTSSSKKEQWKHGSSLGINGKMYLNWDNSSKEGYLQASLVKELEGKKKTSWNLDIGGKWNKLEAKKTFKRYNTITDITKKVVDGYFLFCDIINNFLFKELDNIPKKTWGLDFSMDFFVKYENAYIEDTNSFFVGKYHDWSFGGKILGFKWSYDISSMLLRSLGGWFGTLLVWAKIKLEKAKLAGLTISISFNVNFKIDDINFRKIDFFDKKENQIISGKEAKISTDAGIELVANGWIQFGIKKCGVKASTNAGFILEATGGANNISINFTGIVVTGVIYCKATSEWSSDPLDGELKAKTTFLKEEKDKGKEVLVMPSLEILKPKK